MDTDRQTAIVKDFEAFMQHMQAVESRLDLAPEIAKFVELCRETAFRAGWSAGREWQEHHDAEAPTVRCPPVRKVEALVRVGDRGWVQPLAIIEHIVTGELFIDPRFTMARQPSDRCCIEIVVTAEGLLAIGPNDLHRLTHEIDPRRLRPILRVEAPAIG